MVRAEWTLTLPSIYKILTRTEWELARRTGVFKGSVVDHKDGFIHFSSALQVRETAAQHFAGQSDLMLLTIDSGELGQALKWEASRGGDLFPHLYGPLDMKMVQRAEPLPLDGDRHIFAKEIS
jgi:uncharacterized protein (DUF952 family)